MTENRLMSYPLAQSLVETAQKNGPWIRDLDALDNEQIVSLYDIDRTHVNPVHWPIWDLISKNVQLIMRVRFAAAVREGKLSRDC